MNRGRCVSRHPQLGVRCELKEGGKHEPGTTDHRVFRRRKRAITWPNPVGLVAPAVTDINKLYDELYRAPA